MKYQWIDEYNCGCSEVQKRKKDLLGYCGVHGDESKRRTKLPVLKGTEMETGQTK